MMFPWERREADRACANYEKLLDDRAAQFEKQLERTMNTNDILTGQICEGDYVLDPLDGMQPRRVTGFTIHNEWTTADATVHFDDGGCMAIIEIPRRNIRLESEVE